ncbi:hypothetical protein E4U12_008021 [Claviceps purpurea]|nr:hypothetical protein E4U12_008021 [Claviceps purpurea]
MSNNNYPHYYLFKDDAFDVNADWKNKTNMTLDLMEIVYTAAKQEPKTILLRDGLHNTTITRGSRVKDRNDSQGMAPDNQLQTAATRRQEEAHQIINNHGPRAQPGAAVTRRKGAWLPSEDDLLKRRVLNKGASDWVEKSRYVGTRTAKQCRERWHQTLNPDLNHAPITREEGDIILDWVTQKGTPWTLDQDRPPPERSE